MDRLIGCVCAVLLLFLLGCGGSEVSLGGGGGTETVGTIITQDGDPASGAKVLFVPLDFDPMEKMGELQPDSVLANEKGEFLFADIADGSYNIFYESGGDRRLRREVVVTSGAADTIIVDTLDAPGAIHGVVRLRPEDQAQHIYILLMGSTRFYQPLDSTGRFRLTGVPEGTYDVRFITTEDNYDDLDTVFTVNAGKSDTLTDTIYLPYTGLLPPKGVSVKYDTLLQQTMISWEKTESPRLEGYQIKRRENMPGASFEVIATCVKGTTFVDTINGESVIQNGEYLYTVQAVDRDGETGQASSAKSVQYVSSFALEQSKYIELNQVSEWADIETDSMGRLWITSVETKELIVVHGDGLALIRRLDMASKGTPYDVECMSDSTILVATSKGVYNLGPYGDSLHFFPIRTYEIASKDARYLYYCSRSQENFSSGVLVFDMHEGGEPDTLFHNEIRDIASMVIEKNEIYLAFTHYRDVYLASSSLDRYKPKNYFGRKGYSGEVDINVHKGVVRLLATDEVCTYSPKRKIVSRSAVPPSTIALTHYGECGFTLWNSNGVLSRYLKK